MHDAENKLADLLARYVSEDILSLRIRTLAGFAISPMRSLKRQIR